MKKVKELLTNKLVKIGVLLLAILIVFIVFTSLFNNEEKLDTSFIITTLEKASELTTAKLNYTGVSEYKDSGIAILNKSNFMMVYEATARAGIDVKEVKIEVDEINNIVWLTIPKSKILDVKVDSSKIKYYDEKFSLFNFNSKDDANEAVSLAEKDAKKEFSKMGVLEMADTQAEALIKGIVQDVIPKEYTIKVKK